MRKSIIAVTAALALGLASSVMAGTVTHSDTGSQGNLQQGSAVQAGSISGATTTGTGFAGTYGISNMGAQTTGRLRSDLNTAVVIGTTSVQGHSESGTLVEGAGAAGSIAGGNADAFVTGDADFAEGTHQHGTFFGIPVTPAYNFDTTQEGNADINAGSTGSSWAATGSIGDGEGTSVQGFTADGDASAKSKIKTRNNGTVKAISNVTTSSGATAYTLETGNAIGETEAAGLGFAGADVYRQHDDD